MCLLTTLQMSHVNKLIPDLDLGTYRFFWECSPLAARRMLQAGTEPAATCL